MKKIMILAFLFLISLSFPVKALDVTAASDSAADIQNAVNQVAVAGGWNC